MTTIGEQLTLDAQTVIDASRTEVKTLITPVYNVKGHEAKGDGKKDDTDAIQDALDAASAAGGGTVFFPPGTYIVSSTLWMRNYVRWLGIPHVSIIKLKDGAETQMVGNETQTSGSTIDYASFENLVFDGNNANNTEANAIVAVNGCKRFEAKNCTFRNGAAYGLAMQAHVGNASGITGEQSDIYLENCHFANNGTATGLWDGIDIKDCKRATLVGCHAYGNTQHGFDIRGQYVHLIGCHAYNNGEFGYELRGNHNANNLPASFNLAGCTAYSNTLAGLYTDNGASGAVALIRLNLSACDFHSNGTYGVQVNNPSLVEFSVAGGSIRANTSHGIYIEGIPRRFAVTGAVIESNGGDGARLKDCSFFHAVGCVIRGNAGYGFQEEGSSGRNHVLDCEVLDNIAGQIKWVNKTSNFRGSIDYLSNSTDTIASADTITLPEGAEFVNITGATNITTIAPSYRGRRVTLRFDSSLTVVNGSNLKLAGNFNATQHDTLTLICDGTTWFETSRSTN